MRKFNSSISAAVWGCELLLTRTWHARAKPSPLSDGNEARRCNRPGFGAYRGGAPHHDGEVESAVMEDAAVLLLRIRGRARYAQAHVPKRLSRHCVPRVLQGWLLRHEELVGFFGPAVDFFKEGHH